MKRRNTEMYKRIGWERLALDFISKKELSKEFYDWCNEELLEEK